MVAQLILPRRSLLKSGPMLALFPQAMPPAPTLRPGTATKLRCAILYGPFWPAWAYFWNTFDWFGYVKPAIDSAHTIGANCIKVTLGGVSPDTGTNYPADAVLRTNLRVFCDYAGSLGMAVYLQLGYVPYQQFLTDGTGVAAGTAAAAKIAGWADSIPNIVGIDCMNECDIGWPSTWTGQGSSGGAIWPGNPGQMLADLTTYMAGIRAATRKPLTISTASAVASRVGFFAPFVDYHDIHYYYYNNANNAPAFDATVYGSIASMKAASWYKGMYILGETGMPDSQGVANQTAWASAVPGLTKDAQCSGGCWWVIGDTYGSGLIAGNWGIYTQGFGSVRTALSVPFGTWPGAL